MSRCILTPLFILAAFTTVSAHDECLIDPPEGVSTVPRGSVKVGKMVTAFCMGKGRVPYDIVQLPCEEHTILDTSDYPVCVQEEVHFGVNGKKSRRTGGKKRKGTRRRKSRTKGRARVKQSKSRKRKPVVSYNYEEKVTPAAEKFNNPYPRPNPISDLLNQQKKEKTFSIVENKMSVLEAEDHEEEYGNLLDDMLDSLIEETKEEEMGTEGQKEEQPDYMREVKADLLKITENKYERCPQGLKLTVTDEQFKNMWRDGYFGAWYKDGAGRKKLEGGYIITLNKDEELMFMDNIKNSCQNFKLAEQMFPCVPMKITENKWERNPMGQLKLIVTTGQFIKMWKDGYFGTGYRGQDKKMVLGGYIITFTKEEEVKFMENIKTSCKFFKLAEKMFPCDETEEGKDEMMMKDKSMMMEDKAMMMKDKSMMMEDKPSKVTENTYEQCPAGLKLTVTVKQFENMWRDGYFEGSVAKSVGLNKKKLNGGYFIQLNKKDELAFLGNIKRSCKSFKRAEQMFPCDKAQLDSLSVVKSRIMEDKSMMMKDKSMMMNDKSLKVTENKYEKCPTGGLTLTVTNNQFYNMYKDGYFEGELALWVALNKKAAEGGYVIKLDKDQEIEFMENIRTSCRNFKWAEAMFPCND